MKYKIRVTYMMSRFRPGGTFTLTNSRIKYLHRIDQGIVEPRVCAFLPTSRIDGVQSVLEKWESLGVHTNVLEHTGVGRSARTMRIMKNVANETDIFHIMNAPLSYSVFASRMYDKPYIVEWIGSSVASGRSGRLGGAMDFIAAKLASANVAISKSVRDIIPANDNIKVIYPPINLAGKDAPPPEDLVGLVKNRGPVLLVVSRLAPLKGIGHIVPVMERVVRRFPSALLLIAGSGPEEADLRAGIRKAGIEENVAMLGFRDDVFGLHKLADIYISTSEFEGLVGYSTLEAAIAGTPIVASSIPSVSEVLRHGRDALLVSPSDYDGYASSIESVYLEDIDGHNLAISGRERVYDLIDPVKSTNELVSLYSNIFNARY